jgi:hypothetical protein
MKKILLPLMAAAVLHSCTTTNKTKTLKKEETKTEKTATIDSTTTASLDSAGMRRSVIVAATESQDDFTKITVIEFDTMATPRLVNTLPLIGDATPAEDYVTEIGNIRARGRVKSITIKETGNKTAKAKTETTTTDTAHKKADATADVKRTESVKTESKVTEKNKHVFRIDSTGLVVGSIILLILAAVCYYYRKRISLFLSVVKLKIWPIKSASRSSQS